MASMFYCPLRPTLRIIAIYAIVCLFWAGFADRVAPKIIAAAHDEQNLSILHLVFRSSLPVKYYLDRWSVIAAAGLLAAILHLLIVLFICGIERKRRTQSLDAGRPSNTGLVVFSAAFLAIAVLSGAEGDYKPYLEEWTAV